MKAIAKVEFWGLVLFLVILFVIFFQAQPFIVTQNLFQSTDWSCLFLPYGVILFSLWGVALVPEIEEMLGEQKKKLLKIIPIAILIPAIVYLFFIYIVLGVMGTQTTEEALPGLRDVLGDNIASLALLFGLLTTFTSFIALGLTLKKVFWYDLKLSKKTAWAITCFIPLFLYLIGIQDFIAVIFFVGAVMLAIDGVLILLMYRKAEIGGRASKIKRLAVYPLLLGSFGWNSLRNSGFDISSIMRHSILTLSLNNSGCYNKIRSSFDKEYGYSSGYYSKNIGSFRFSDLYCWLFCVWGRTRIRERRTRGSPTWRFS
jgi:amino acid permease